MTAPAGPGRPPTATAPPDGPAGRVGSYRAAFVALTVACYLGLVAWPDFMAALGAGHAGVWFLDMNTLLASNDAVVAGLDPYQPNPLDYLRDSHAYSDWWLQLRHLGLGRPDRLWLGALVDLLFFAAVFWKLRPASFREALAAWLLVWSPPLILGFNRANPDLLVAALLLPVAALLTNPRPLAKAAAVAATAVAIGLKYYPAAACLVIFVTAASRRELGWLLVTWAVVGAALALNLLDDVARTGGLMAVATGFYTFGAAALAANVGHGLAVFGAGFTAMTLAFGLGWFRPVFAVDAGRRTEVADFALGAGLLVACFVLTISYSYRLVFGLLLVPWLLELARRGAPAERRYAWLVLGSGVAIFWADGVPVLLINSLIGTLGDAALGTLIHALVVALHVARWLWVLLLLAGLAAIARPTVARWWPAARLTGGG